MDRRLIYIPIITLFLGAALWGLSTQNFFDPDEGYYLQGGKTVHAAAVYAWRKAFGPAPGGFKDFLAAAGGDVPVGAKHGFLPLVGLSMLLLGVKPIAGQAVSVLAGLLGILAVYHMGRRLGPPGTGAAAALMLAASALWLCLARSVYTNPAALALALWCLALHQQSLESSGRRAWGLALAAGALGGWGFCCHYSVLPFLLWALGVEFLVLVASRLGGARASRSLLPLPALALGLLLVPALIQAGTWLIHAYLAGAGAALDGSGRPFNITTFWQQLVIQFNVAGGHRLIDPWFYPRYLNAVEGPLYPSLGGLGIALLAWRALFKRNLWALYWLGLTIGICAALTINEVKVSRVAIYLLPLLALAGGSALAWAWPRARWLVIAVLALLVAEGVWAMAPVVTAQSRFPLAIEYLRARGSVLHLASDSTKSGFWAGQDNTVIAETVDAKEAVRLARARGARWFVLDGCGPFFNSPLVRELIEKKVPFVFEVPENPPRPFVLENLLYMDRPKPLWAHWPFQTRVYDMEEIARRLTNP